MTISGNWDRRMSRRAFIGLGGMSAAALMLGGAGEAFARKGRGEPGYGPLRSDPGGVVDLPRGFQYRIISAEGSTLSNGAPVPSDHDGMAAFKGPKKGTTLLVRNHELTLSDESSGDNEPVAGRNPYDPSRLGGTTGIVVDNKSRKEVEDFVTSSGTDANCAGGATPWGTWLTCEESLEPGHGYVFEVTPEDPESDLSRTPILGMGSFSHEAVDIDPDTGIAYLTEDDPGGNANTGDPNQDPGASFLFRYVPNNRSQQPGALQEGGQLQVMTLDEVTLGPGPDADLYDQGERIGVRWVDVANPESAREEALAKGGIRFNRLEGAFFEGGAFWFDDTLGGEERLGQIFRYFPRMNVLELFYEGTEATKIQSPDNITITPWGDLWFAEDEVPTLENGDGRNRVVGVTPQGEVYEFARNVQSDSEFAGPTFAPNGKTFFVNIQNPGLTLAIWGPFKDRNRRRRRRMALAAPPLEFAPTVSGELAEAAQRYGMSNLEAAAYDRLGVSLAV